MTQFPHIPALHRCPNRGRQRVYAICGDLYYPDGSIVVRGFKTDGASRPWFLNKWLKRFGRGFAAFIKHDYDYAMQIVPRKQADDKLLKLLRSEESTSEFSHDEAQLIYKLIRMFGWISWKRNQRRDATYFFCSEFELNNTENNEY